MVNREPGSVEPAGEMSYLHKSHKILYFLFFSVLYRKVWNCGASADSKLIFALFFFPSLGKQQRYQLNEGGGEFRLNCHGLMRKCTEGYLSELSH